MSHVMIDTETLSLRPNAAILSIAAVAFKMDGTIIDTLHIASDRYNNRYIYEHVDKAVCAWWGEQSQAAIDAMYALHDHHAYRLDLALEALNRFVKRHLSDDSGVWSNGAGFDLPILHSAYRHFDITSAWPFWRERDCRTIVTLAEQITGINTTKTTAFTGIKHTALADAEFQAAYVAKAYQLLCAAGAMPGGAQ